MNPRPNTAAENRQGKELAAQFMREALKQIRESDRTPKQKRELAKKMRDFYKKKREMFEFFLSRPLLK